MSNTAPVITVENLTKVYNAGLPNEVRALAGVTLQIHEGDFTAITGPSGSGKSTLMHLLGLLDIPSGGKIVIKGADTAMIPKGKLHMIRGTEVGFVFQGFNLLPTLSALENVAEAALYVGVNRKESARQAKALLERVGLGDRLHNFPHELSGGQQQRVAIARALINKPSIVLADEPTGELDSKNAQAIMDLLEDVNRTNGQTVVLVTHSEAVAARCRTTISMSDGLIAEIRKKGER